MKQPDRKPTAIEISQAVLAMAEVVPFFPRTEVGQEVIIHALESFVGSKRGLDWLTNRAVAFEKWRGISDLRGVYCSAFEPADGVYGVPETPGYSAEDCERDYYQREAAETARRIEGWKQQLLTAGEGIQPFMPAPAVKGLTSTNPSRAELRRLEQDIAEQAARARRRSPEESERLLRELEEQLQHTRPSSS